MVQLFVPPEAVPNFITTFSAIKNRLNIELSVTRPKEEPLDLSHYVDQLLTEEEYDDEEYDWVPWSKSEMWHDYHQYHAEVDVWIVPSSRDSDSSAPVHYLSDDARSPIFVDALSAKDLQSKSAEERNLLAPLAKAQVVETEEGEDIVYKYHDPYRWKYPIYVGETWTRKVEKSIKHHGGDGDSVFVVQTAL
ncbi:hypothetical protein SERLA73DRAFT_174912 [Serpula lacrymans var. lacrymans S7.3]|uniref:Uncharacterized protein n=2 Tax=Serpula lacrymans var. lacrymans TaxID=341189 RepID=F8PJ72_SERL3|nr:uncharacterized protein SERLADRAFT_456636 [Serpula lacrymans var. lacrymans S7.9]EGO03436.1 hypothetical protein SERLA73DRAFT_174912 [Serpula lacrymans var. lacrymans S7.3]EGO29200.1 hypothetical protein SERLADRAFT_456636 [Serpula lacrymans var. lacrymans S7.9]